MEEIKVGEYVRINNDFRLIALGIGKVTRTNKDTIYVKMNFELPFAFKVGNIAKHSPDIIDLIEKGDYVNGYLVKDIDYAFNDVALNKKNARIVPYIDCNKINYIDDIKSIVTKEQFNQMKYIVGGE